MTTPRSLGEALSSMKRRLTLVERRLSLSSSGGGSGALLMASSAAERDERYPAPFQGLRVIRLDKGWEEMYYETYNAATNPGGASPAGWYPLGNGPTLIGISKGNTTLINGTWTWLNTGTGDGTNIRNDGFTYGAGDIDVPIPGVYDVSVTVNFGSTANGEARLVRLFADDDATTFAQDWRRIGSWSSQAQFINVAGTAQLGSKLMIQAYQNSGAAMNSLLANVEIAYRGVRRV